MQEDKSLPKTTGQPSETDHKKKDKDEPAPTNAREAIKPATSIPKQFADEALANN